MLIAARAILGIAGATLAPSTLSLIRNMFADDDERRVAIGIWVTSFSAGGALGPVVGGALLAHFWWGSVFLIGVPVMVLLLAVGPSLLPEFRDPDAGRMDVVSALLSLAAVLLVIYGIKQFAQGTGGWAPAATILAGLAVGAAFVRRQRRLADPLIDLRLFRRPAFSTALAAYTLGTFVAFGMFLYVSQYLQLVRGLSPLRAGICILPVFGAFITGSMLAPVIVRHIRPATLMVGGLALAAVGFAALGRVDAMSSVATIVAGCTVYSLGLAPVFTLATDMIVGAAPPERAGAAAALSEAGSELGGALGIALLGSFGTAVYRGAMVHGVPGATDAGVAEAVRGTLGGATAVAARLPAPRGGNLIDAARGAFSPGLGLTAVICAAVAVATSIAVALMLRPASSSTSPAGSAVGEHATSSR
jgi:DHA2 family multidrug resistance protein-like MFS transporter